MLFNILNVTLVQSRELRPGIAVRAKKFIKLRMQRLRIAIPVRLMNRVIIHVANDATAAQPNVPGEKRSHATVKAATMANAVGWVVNSPRRVSARRNASIINVKATGSKAVPPAAAGGMRRRLVKTHRDIPMF